MGCEPAPFGRRRTKQNCVGLAPTQSSRQEKGENAAVIAIRLIRQLDSSRTNPSF
jgi:hypothetical protein